MLDRLKIASPCSADWEQMKGTDRVRFCGECKKNVFNLSAMTRREAEGLLRETNGNLCTFLYRRNDGTVLTADCPVGLRVRMARIRRRVGWSIAAAMGLSTAFAQQGASVLAGVVKDSLGAPIARASITVVSERTGAKAVTNSDESGHFRLTTLARDIYTINVMSPGFSIATKKDVELKGEVGLQFELLVGTAGGPIFVEPAKASLAEPQAAAPSRRAKPWWRRVL